jgi:N-acetylglucosaminyldiphosphoundecaprenol N-acetyl-beta-D-mannosaminyltransferase
MLMMMRRNWRLQRFIDGAAICVADGQPLVWASKLQRTRIPERIAGVDLVDALCRIAADSGFRVYFLGAKLDVIQQVARRMQSKYPSLHVCGVADGYIAKGEAASRARAIRDSKTQLLFVGMGVPRQEEFLADQWDNLGVNLAVPVGGSFDVIAGRRRRAPIWIQRSGMEWLYRLGQEPRRLWKRYLVTNTQFLLLMLAAMIYRDHSQATANT